MMIASHVVPRLHPAERHGEASRMQDGDSISSQRPHSAEPTDLGAFNSTKGPN